MNDLMICNNILLSVADRRGCGEETKERGGDRDEAGEAVAKEGQWGQR